MLQMYIYNYVRLGHVPPCLKVLICLLNLFFRKSPALQNIFYTNSLFVNSSQVLYENWYTCIPLVQGYLISKLKLVYVIGWGAVVFGINCTSNVGKKL